MNQALFAEVTVICEREFEIMNNEATAEQKAASDAEMAKRKDDPEYGPQMMA